MAFGIDPPPSWPMVKVVGAKATGRQKKGTFLPLPLAPPPVLHAGGVLPVRALLRSRPSPAVIVFARPPWLAPVSNAGAVPRPFVSIRGRRRRRRPLWRIAQRPPRPANSAPGWLILFYHGPYSTMPVLASAEPAWANDAHQLFVGDGQQNHFIGGISSAPISSSSPGMPGMTASDGTYLYFCVAKNQWMRAALSAF